MKKYYDINYSLLVRMLMPVMLRNDMQTAFLKALVSCLIVLNKNFSNYVSAISTTMAAQVCYMQAMLNNRFGGSAGQIIVRTATIDMDSFLLWLEAQNKPIEITREDIAGYKPYLLSRDGQIGTTQADFEVVLPSALTLGTSELRQLETLVNRNKLASKKYQIVYE